MKVLIDKSHAENRGQEVLTSINFVEKLKAAGIPVIGTIVIRGVERGTLSHTNDADGNHMFEWTNDDLFV